jgi:DNA adenine methylase
MQSFIRYPGGKSKLVKKIVPILQQRTFHGLEYREPFFGGGSVGLSMIEAKREAWINDRDAGIIALWQAVQHHSESLKAMVCDYSPSVDDFYAFKKFFLSAASFPLTVDELVSVAFRKLALHQMSFSGLGCMSGGPLGGKEQAQNGISSRWNATSICKKLDAIHAAFGSVRISNGDYAELIGDETTQALLYLDPPYFEQGEKLYLHAFAQRDHKRLRDLLRATPHHWVLSYNACREIRELYHWAHIETISANYSLNGAKEKYELLIFKQAMKLSCQSGSLPGRTVKPPLQRSSCRRIFKITPPILWRGFFMISFGRNSSFGVKVLPAFGWGHLNDRAISLRHRAWVCLSLFS